MTTSDRTNPLDIVTGLVLPSGDRWGDVATDVQFRDAAAFLEAKVPYHWIGRSRGYSKTEDAAAIVLADMLTGPPGSRSFWLAADSEQGRLALESLEGFLARTPWLSGRLIVQTRRALCPETGSSLDVIPADAASSWGIRARNIVADELCNWDDVPSVLALWRAVRTSLTKFVDSRLLVVSTPSDPAHFSRAELDHAYASPLWRVSETHGPAPWTDPDKLAEQRAALPAPIYQQLYEGLWVPGAGAFLDPETLDRAITLHGPNLRPGDISARYTAGLDLGAVRDAAVFTICHRDGPRVVLDLMMRWTGTRKDPVSFSAIEEAILAEYRRFRFTRLLTDPWQALPLLERLRAKGVAVEEFHFSQQSKQRLAGVLLSLFQEGNIDLYDVPGLRAELLALRLVQHGANWSFDHRVGGHDDRAVSLALAALGAVEGGFGGPVTSFSALPLALTHDQWAERGRVADRYDSSGQFVGSRHTDLPPRGSGR